MFGVGAINVSGEARRVEFDYLRRFHPPAFHNIARRSALEEGCMDVDISRPVGSPSTNLPDAFRPQGVRRWLPWCFQNVIEINCFLCGWIGGHHRARTNTFY